MTNKIFTGLTTLSLLIGLLFVATGHAQIDVRKAPPVKQKVLLPCEAITKDVATTLFVTNSTQQALPVNQVIYYSTNKNQNGYFKSSSQVAAGQLTSYPLTAGSGSSCQAWMLK
ncbi:MAG: hypothetical protein HYR56_09435 [Acidobacteria bacterium]|nr:hypothetical protein [Acidobacteriota bacterium]MBI3425844.1 hypothetical protein [Acidobacteriota bacterium]